MKRFLLSLLLPLFLLIAQQGALQHELSHVVEAHSAEHTKKHATATLCDECLNFAQVAVASTAFTPPQALLAQLDHQLNATPWASQTQVGALPPRSRGPPTLL